MEDIKRSRVYLELHWNFDCTRGAESGDRVAKVVYESLYRRTRKNRRPEVSEFHERRSLWMIRQCHVSRSLSGNARTIPVGLTSRLR